jgi:hypothetical protein
LGVEIEMYEKQILEKWLDQLKNDQLNPEFVGAGLDKEKAIKKIQDQITKLSINKSVTKEK